MTKIIIDKEQINEIERIEKSIITIEGFSLAELITNGSFKNIYFFSETFLLRFDVIQLIYANNIDVKDLYLIAHNNSDATTCIQVTDINEMGWDQIFDIDNTFVNIVYADYTTIFDETKKWLFFHKIDYPNILFCNEKWDIPAALLKYLQTFEDAMAYFNN